MPVSNEDTNELVDRAVREILTIRKEGERSTVVVKVRKLGIYKDRIHHRLRNTRSHTSQKLVNCKFFVI